MSIKKIQEKHSLEDLLNIKRYKDVLDEIQEKYEKRQSMLIKPSHNMEEYVIDTSTMIPEGLEVYDLMKAMQKMYQRKNVITTIRYTYF